MRLCGMLHTQTLQKGETSAQVRKCRVESKKESSLWGENGVSLRGCRLVLGKTEEGQSEDTVNHPAPPSSETRVKEGVFSFHE